VNRARLFSEVQASHGYLETSLLEFRAARAAMPDAKKDNKTVQKSVPNGFANGEP